MTMLTATCCQVHRWYIPASANDIILVTCMECGARQWQANTGYLPDIKKANQLNARDGYPLIVISPRPVRVPVVRPDPITPAEARFIVARKLQPARIRAAHQPRLGKQKRQPICKQNGKPICKPKPAKKASGRRNHEWTPAELELVWLHYNGTRESVKLLSKLTGASFYGVKGQVMRLGLARVKPSNWSPEELKYLADNIHRKSVKTISREMGRSINAVKVKATRLHYRLREHHGWYTKKEVAEICGVDHKKVQEWFDGGYLKAIYHFPDRKPTRNGSAMWHIEKADFAAFLKAHCQELLGRNVDLVQILTICGVIEGDNR